MIVLAVSMTDSVYMCTFFPFPFCRMKGAMSDSSSLFYYGMMRHLYPSTSYRHNSGGDPAHIPSLTHEEFVNFHKKHYHPSNSIFFSYVREAASFLFSVQFQALSR